MNMHLANRTVPLISVCMITYNHADYIAAALDSILMQNGDFKLEIIIGEDCSTDSTRDILLVYREKYPDIVRLLLHEKNVGMNQNFIQTLQACQGEYIAILEGDDYWIDTLKLQKQLNFLESNPDFTLCATRFLEDRSGKQTKISVEGSVSFDNSVIFNSFGTLTTLFRASALHHDVYRLLNEVAFPDWPLWLSLLRNGTGFILNDITAVYRVHEGGVFSAMDHYKRNYTVYQTVIQLMNDPLFSGLAQEAFKKSGRDKLRNLFKEKYDPQHWAEIKTIIQSDSNFLSHNEKKILLSLYKISNTLFRKIAKKMLL